MELLLLEWSGNINQKALETLESCLRPNEANISYFEMD